MMSKVLGIIVARLALKMVSLREFIEVLERRRKLTYGFIKVHSNRSTFTKQQQAAQICTSSAKRTSCMVGNDGG